ncbi:MAG TPA: hypothetical protein VFM05_10525, partial [Candidatus Saccharimonadales bacterium]|nr:hypothetical protein [Candidatus Saccharimonadales bacterium]
SKAATQVGMENTAIQRALAAEKKADAAESKAEESEQRADAFQIRLRQLEIRFVRLESKMRYFVAMVHDPYATLEVIRERVPRNFADTKDNHNG